MPSQEKTKHLGLNQWQGNEYVKRQDFVDDNQIIDSAVETITEEVEAIQSDIYSPQYSDQKTTVAPVISMKNTVDGKLKYTLKGRTLTNLVQNGNFKDGTSGWGGGGGSSTISVSENTLSITGTGSAMSSYVDNTSRFSWSYGKKVFFKARVRVTNSDVTVATLQLRVSSGSAISQSTISNPIQNRWYELKGVSEVTTQTGRILTRLFSTYPNAATANGKVMEVQEVVVLDLDQYPDLQGLTADEINALIPGYIDGMQSVENVKMVSVGENLIKGEESQDDSLFNIGYGSSAYRNKWVDGKLEVYNGSVDVHGRGFKLNVEPNTAYKLSFVCESAHDGAASRIAVEPTQVPGQNMVLFGTSLTPGKNEFTINTPTGEFWVRFLRFGSNNSGSPVKFCNFMLSKFKSEYEPYKESTMFLPLPLRQLPNGVADTIDSEGNYVRRTNEIILQDSNFYGLNTSASTNVDVVSIILPADRKNYGTHDAIGNNTITSVSIPRRGISTDTQEIFWRHYFVESNATLAIAVPKGTYANIGAARAALAGTKVIYELGTPVVSKINIPPVTSFKDGTLMFQNRRKYVLRAEDIESMYTTYANVDIAFLNKSKLIDYIAIGQLSTGTIDVNGWLETEGGANIQLVQNIGKYSTSGNVGSVLFIFPKGTTLAQAREQLAGLEIEYETIPYPLPQIEYTYPLNLAAGQQGNTEMIAQLNSVFQDLGEGGEYGTATSAEVMEGYTLGTEKGVIDGKMLNIGAVTNTITTQGGQYTIPQGYHRGSGKVTASFPNLIPENIKEGINIGGILGSAKTYSIDFQCNKKEIGSGDFELGRFILPSSWKFLYLEASADQGSNFVIINKSLFHSNYEKRESSYDGILVLSDVSVSDNNVLDFRIYNKHKNSQLVNYRCYAVI